MIAKIIYFNWHKAEREGLMRPTWTGELLADRPDLYDHVGDFEYLPGGYRSEERVREMAFRKFNRVEEGDMDGMKIRSMSVGDVILFEDAKMFVVAGMGWTEIPTGIDKLAFWGLDKVEEQAR